MAVSASIPQPEVVVVHPGVQHSRRLVAALNEAGLLALFITSSDGRFRDAPWLPRAIRKRLRLRACPGVPSRNIRVIPLLEVGSRILSRFAGLRVVYAGLSFFDRIAACFVSNARPRIVVGVENSCREVFRRGHAIGATCVLDAASVHYEAQAEEPGHMSTRLRRSVDARKREEIALADHVVVLSTYARDTYMAAGVPPDRITVLAPGADLQHQGGMRSWTAPTRFLFVGNVKYAKGVDLLMQAFERLERDAELDIAGSLVEPGLLPAVPRERVRYLGRLERDALDAAYSRAHVLVLPSRGDGFGFVVAEAMSRGLPVIVSSAVGAKDIVTPGENGWIFASQDVEALRRCMQEACASPDLLGRMSDSARHAAATVTWEAYTGRVQALYRRLLDDRGNAA